MNRGQNDETGGSKGPMLMHVTSREGTTSLVQILCSDALFCSSNGSRRSFLIPWKVFFCHDGPDNSHLMFFSLALLIPPQHYGHSLTHTQAKAPSLGTPWAVWGFQRTSCPSRARGRSSVGTSRHGSAPSGPVRTISARARRITTTLSIAHDLTTWSFARGRPSGTTQGIRITVVSSNLTSKNTARLLRIAEQPVKDQGATGHSQDIGHSQEAESWTLVCRRGKSNERTNKRANAHSMENT